MIKKHWYLILFIFNMVFAIGQNTDSLKTALKNAKHDTTRCYILSSMIEGESDGAVWSKYNEELLKITESKLKKTKQKDPEYKLYQKYLADALNNVGYLAEQKGDIIKAIDYYGRSIKIQEEIGNKQGIALSLNNIGAIYFNQGDIPSALDYQGRSLKIQEEIGNKYGIAQSLNNIGTVYNSQKDFPKVLEYYGRSLKIFEEIGHKQGFATSLNNIGLIYSNLGDISKALEYHGRSLKINEEIGDKVGTAYSLSNIGIIYYKQGDIPKALEYQSRSLRIREDIGDKDGIAYSLNIIGGIYLKQKNYSKALEKVNQSMKVSKEIGYPQNIRNAAERLNAIYKATNNYKLALENYELYIQMRDSTNNLETQKTSIKQQTQYAYNKQKAVEDEKHKSELRVREEKAQADKKRQNIIIVAVSIVLLLVAIFSVLLYSRFKTTQQQKQIIEAKEKETQYQKNIIEEKQKEIVDSINYAKRIQYTLLAHIDFLKENIPNNFVYFTPKDIVSGDFYWATKQNNKFYLAVCDSTGHGVPGAFMSLLNIGFLSEAINEKNIDDPGKVLDHVRARLIESTSKEGQQDGFDGILIAIDEHSKEIKYAAANNSPILIHDGTIIELEKDSMPVGIGERKNNFSTRTITLNKGDVLYLYTDGYADQFGGPKGKKYKYKQLNERLLELSKFDMDKQRHELAEGFKQWKGNLEQVDDVCVIGIRF